MRTPRHRLRTLDRGWGGRRRGGFTLLEVILTLSIIMLAGGLFFIALDRIQQRGRGARFEADLQAFASACEKYRAANGRWPSTLEQALPSSAGAGPKVSPFGGHYGWLPPDGKGRPGLIVVTAFSPDFPLALPRAELLEIDRRMDDGDLSTGRFRTGFNGWPAYLVEDNP